MMLDIVIDEDSKEQVSIWLVKDCLCLRYSSFPCGTNGLSHLPYSYLRDLEEKMGRNQERWDYICRVAKFIGRGEIEGQVAEKAK